MNEFKILILTGLAIFSAPASSKSSHDVTSCSGVLLAGTKNLCHQTASTQVRHALDVSFKTALREWAYARACKTSDQRARHLPAWNRMYNWHRPHGSLHSQPPISRLGLNEYNLLRHHI